MRVFAEHGSYVVACRVDHVGDLPDSQARRGQHLTRLGQSVVQHVRHQNGRLAGAHTRQARIPGAAGAEVLLGCYGAGAARHTRVDRNRREVTKPSSGWWYYRG